MQRLPNQSLTMKTHRQVYDIEWYAGGAKYDYEIAVDTGEIISSGYEGGKTAGERVAIALRSVKQLREKTAMTV